MIKRNVNFTVAADGTVEPRIPQYGGVKGEHNATMCRIVLLDTAYEDGDRLRLSFTTGDGTYLSTEHMEEIVSTDGGVCVEYALPQAVTVGAGQLCMRAVLVRLTDGEEKEVARSGEMVLYFDEATVENGTPFWTGVSQMLERTVAAGEAAVGAQTTATNAAAKAEVARNNAYSYYLGAQEKASDAAHSAENSKNQAAIAEQAANKAEEAVNTPGRQGASAYEVAVANGFDGDEAAWLASLKGKNGKSAYEAAVEGGFKGTEEEFASLLADDDGGTVHFKGQVKSGTHLINVAKKFGDVWFIENDAAFYMWNGAEFKVLGGGGGTNGIIPHIGANGNWFIGDTDTGVKAAGTSGIHVGGGEMPDDCFMQYDDSDVLKYNPDTKNDAMTLPVGVDENGKLWVAPTGIDSPEGGGGGTEPTGADWEYIGESTPDNQLIFESGKYKEFFVEAWIHCEENIGVNNYTRLYVDGVVYFPWNGGANYTNHRVYGLLNRKMSLTFSDNTNLNSYLDHTSRGNAQISLPWTPWDGSDTKSLGTCFWMISTGKAFDDFRIKLWGRR